MAAEHMCELDKLCRICGFLLPKNKNNTFKVSNPKVSRRMQEHLFRNIEKDTEALHPTKICMKCYSRLGQLDYRKSTSNFELFKWSEHTEQNCNVCENEIKRKKGGKPRKRMSTGRYSVSNSHWTRYETSEINEMLGETVVLMKQNFKEKFNDNLYLCICQLCESLMQKPVLLTKCPTAFLLQMLYTNSGGSPSREYHMSRLLNFGNLKIDCEKCGEVFKHKEYCKENHLSMCVGQNSPLLSDVFKINKENDIPTEFE
ncbi:uncharacterized protein LOC130636963 [Hydractinia symbiolongicarpus]|uniref:uncharacterized protein LOC130636963 n=1 Tax=Hydractinia symbiolongicarpus TaxID=13093 RepID=UPI002549D9EB|nr:uncharacterized protein LOC130636963 [Hydractinia symbiolongicarpus]